MNMKPGDVLMTANPIKWHDYGKETMLPPGNVYAYQLKSATPDEAVFVLTSYRAKAERGHHLNLGKPCTVTTVKIDLPKIIFGLDSGPNHLELGGRGALRSK